MIFYDSISGMAWDVGVACDTFPGFVPFFNVQVRGVPCISCGGVGYVFEPSTEKRFIHHGCIDFRCGEMFRRLRSSCRPDTFVVRN